MRVRIGSRASALAVLQAELVGRAITECYPDTSIEFLTRTSQGDRDKSANLSQMTEKGVFTTDLSQLLGRGEADIVVHSWKDLPVETTGPTEIAGTLRRADPRDVLLVRPEALRVRSGIVRVLTSSPRRAWQLRASAASLFPWPVERFEALPVRGNIPTRLDRLVSGEADGLVVAKAALDRLLTSGDDDSRRRVREAVDRQRWMVLPLREFPTAAAQGALALEIASERQDLRELVATFSDESTRQAVDAERSLLAAHGGGCHAAIGVTVLIRDYGVVTSARGRLPDGREFEQWSLQPTTPLPPPGDLASVWPRPDERDHTRRSPLGISLPSGSGAWWVARADAVPDSTVFADDQIVWAAGTRTWRRLAERGVWVHGCSDGLGDGEGPDIDSLAGRTVEWRRLTHSKSAVSGAVATYDVEVRLPDDLGLRTHFFWSSGSMFVEALRRHPSIRTGWHGCGPGRTSRVLADTIDARSRVSIWLDYEQWLQHVCRK